MNMAKNNFAEFMDELETEAKAEGPAAVAELRAFDKYYAAIADQMRAARKSAGLAQQQLAKRTGIDQAEISRIENGTGDPRRSTLIRYAKGVGGEFRFVAKSATRTTTAKRRSVRAKKR